MFLDQLLGGHAKTLMFAHVSPEADSYGETISTLKFAQRVSTVELGAARVNKENSNVRELKEQVKVSSFGLFMIEVIHCPRESDKIHVLQRSSKRMSRGKRGKGPKFHLLTS